MSSAPAIPRASVTIEQYLSFERASLERHEYVDGRLMAMAGESLEHGIISVNLVNSFATQLKGTPCFVLSKDTKVRSGLGIVSVTSSSGMFSYPDLLVVCGEAEVLDEHRDVIINPVVIAEVLSNSTEAFDRGEKFHRYRTWNPTLKEYLLISQTKPQVEHFVRQPNGTWNMREFTGLDATVTLTSIPCVLKSADTFDRVVFPDNI
ncbi:MAG TPA: Uma2 family endonuclease [Gemmataceae bacterium]|nr:Uma2 family endonuclease [Gemmataceae bacterium]